MSLAQTPDQKAYALYGQFVIVEQQAAALRTSGEMSGTLLSAVQKADSIAKPTADALLQATLDYETASRALAVGTGTPEKLAIATTNLSTWLARAQTDITAFVSAVQGKTP